MIIEKVLLEPFTLRFRKPFRFGNSVLRVKHGVKITLCLGEFRGTGEISLLKQFNTPDENEVQQYFSLIQKFLIGKNPFNVLSEQIRSSETFPAVIEAGIEQSLFSLICNMGQKTPSDLFDLQHNTLIPINGVVSEKTPEDCHLSVQQLIENGIKTVKLKVGVDIISSDVAKLKLLRESFGNKINIRLDANGVWSVKQAEEYLPQLEQFDVEYIEQPVKDCNDFDRLRQKSNIKLAADEGLEDFRTAITIIEQRLADVVIIKPLILGGIRRALILCNKAAQAGIGVVITTSLDGAIGRRAAVITASFISSIYSHGLSTGALFEAETDPDFYLPEKGYIIVDVLRI